MKPKTKKYCDKDEYNSRALLMQMWRPSHRVDFVESKSNNLVNPVTTLKVSGSSNLTRKVIDFTNAFESLSHQHKRKI